MKPSLHQRAMHEFKELVFIPLYLYVTLGAMIMMKTAVLHDQGVAFTPWGIAIVKAVVLAKFMMLGEINKIGGRGTTGPLIWPTLQKAFGLLALLIIMTIIEGSRCRPLPPAINRRLARGALWRRLQETLAGYLIMLVVLIPYGAFRVLGETLGEGRLERMFFVEREPMELR